jgi:hypothetical protein
MVSPQKMKKDEHDESSRAIYLDYTKQTTKQREFDLDEGY